MTVQLTCLIAGVVLATGWQWRTLWMARARVAAGQPSSTRMVTAQALSAGILLAVPGAAWLGWVIGSLADLTGIDQAAWAAMGGTTIATIAIGLAGLDVSYRGLWRGPALRPALRHAPVAVLLPALLVATVPLGIQAPADLGTTMSSTASACVAPGRPVAGYGGEQLKVAAAIVATGREMGVPLRGQVIAVATSMQESGLTVDAVGDGGSAKGPFQQHPSWGSTVQRRDPATSARRFYERLLDVPDWQNLPLTVAAQAVQRSADGSLYAKREQAAAAVVAQTHCS